MWDFSTLFLAKQKKKLKWIYGQLLCFIFGAYDLCDVCYILCQGLASFLAWWAKTQRIEEWKQSVMSLSIFGQVHIPSLNRFSTQKWIFSHNLLTLMPSKMYMTFFLLWKKTSFTDERTISVSPYNASVRDCQSWRFKIHPNKHNRNPFEPGWWIIVFCVWEKY